MAALLDSLEAAAPGDSGSGFASESKQRRAPAGIRATQRDLQRARDRALTALLLEPVAGLEDPRYGRQADGEEQDGHRQAEAHAHIGGLEEAPAEAADQIDNRIAQGDRLPSMMQHIHRVEGAAQKRQRRDDQQRHDLQLLESVGPESEDEAEQT